MTKKTFLKAADIIASWFYSGYAPIAPGTWGSLAAIPFAYVIGFCYGPWGLLIATPLVFFLGIWACQYIIQETKKQDPGLIVVDEVVGQWIALLPLFYLNVPPTLMWLFFLVAFFSFRFFDIVKVFPASWIDRYMKGPWGVMLDDVVAGIYAALITFLFFLVSMR